MSKIVQFGKEVSTDVLTKVKAGDESAFRQVYNMYSSRLYSFAYRFLKNPQLSEEIVQETMIALWLSREKLDARYPMGSYLYTIARRLSLNMLRQIANSQTAFTIAGNQGQSQHSETEDGIIYNDILQHAETLVTKLPHQQQEAFRLSRYSGLSHKQIAKQMQLSENTIKNHITSALKNLHIQFKQSDIFIFLVYLLLK